VLGNLQVAFVGLVAWVVLGERPAGRLLATLPLVLIGVVLVSGVLEQGAYGDDPTQGVIYGLATGLAYTGFILVLRAGSGEQQRVAGRCSTRRSSAALVAVAAGPVIGDADLVPSWPAHAWLATLALTSQVIGWLLISASLPRLPAAQTSFLLTIQPVGSVVLGAILFAEAPSALQLVGVAADPRGPGDGRARAPAGDGGDLGAAPACPRRAGRVASGARAHSTARDRSALTSSMAPSPPRRPAATAAGRRPPGRPPRRAARLRWSRTPRPRASARGGPWREPQARAAAVAGICGAQQVSRAGPSRRPACSPPGG
jgi:hypothetical protein